MDVMERDSRIMMMMAQMAMMEGQMVRSLDTGAGGREAEAGRRGSRGKRLQRRAAEQQRAERGQGWAKMDEAQKGRSLQEGDQRPETEARQRSTVWGG